MLHINNAKHLILPALDITLYFMFVRSSIDASGSLFRQSFVVHKQYDTYISCNIFLRPCKSKIDVNVFLNIDFSSKYCKDVPKDES